MNTRVGFVILAGTLVVAASATPRLSAATPTFWQVASQAEFLKGELQSLAIDTDGRLTLGPATRMVADTTAPMIWDLLAEDDGSLLAGTGNDGKVFRIAPDGTMSVAFDSAELQVHALAPARGGGFYAGTSPDGKVYRVAKDGKGTEVFDPEDKYVWALATSPDGTLYIATGEKGVIYRMGPDGKTTPFYKTRATNVTALAFDAAGNLLAGTSAPGQVLRIDKEGHGFVLLESSYSEVRTIRLDSRGTVFAVAMSAGPGDTRGPERPPTAEPTPTSPVASVSTEITITAIGDVTTTAGPGTTAPTRAEPKREAGRGAVYRINPDGVWDTFWEATDDVPFDALVDRDGLLVATGSKGRLLRVAGDPVTVTLVARADAQQITSLVRTRQGQVHYATANPGKVFDLGQGLVPEGTYESDVRDATTVASWGSLRWRARTPEGTAVRLFTRSGNTRKPDDTWSGWAGPYSNADGQAISSPKARYVQWKAVLSGNRGATPVLSAVTLAYLPRNARPTVASITVHPPGVTFARPYPTGDPEIAGFDSGTAEARPQTTNTATQPTTTAGAPALGRRMYQKGLQTFVWKAEDEPGDRLQFDVYYRRQGDSSWIPLRRGLWDPILTWDTSAVPDGTYTIKVVASDAASNAGGAALTGERESDTFEVDNSAPVITVTGVRAVQGRTVVAFTVVDGHSPLDRVEYSVDATRWRPVPPMDGILDSREERFELTLDAGASLPVTLRAVDALNNVASTVATAPPPAR